MTIPRAALAFALLAGPAWAWTPDYLDGPRVYYVHPDGDDDNTCLADSVDPAKFPHAACQTLQSVYDRIVRTIDTNYYPVTIKVAGTGLRVFRQGLYTGQPWRGHGSLHIVGDPDNPDNVRIDVADDHALRFADGAYTGKVEVSGFRLRAPQGHCIRNGGRLDVWLGWIHFDQCRFGIGTEKRESYIRTMGPYRIAGGGKTHIDADAGFVYVLNDVTIEGNPTFSDAFLEARNAGYILVAGWLAWRGTVDGLQYDIQQGGTISTLGGPRIPGSRPGMIRPGGTLAP
jgi:hypothetical protein